MSVSRCECDFIRIFSFGFRSLSEHIFKELLLLCQDISFNETVSVKFLPEIISLTTIARVVMKHSN